MKNRLYNRIVLCGLLSSSLMLLGMDHDKQVTTSKTPETSQPHQHHSLIQTIEDKAHNLFEHKSTKQPDSPRISASTQTPTQKTPRDKHKKSSSSSSTSMPIDPNHPLAQQQQQTGTHHTHHYGKKIKHVAEEIENAAEKLELTVGNAIDKGLKTIIAHPTDVTEILTDVGEDSTTAKATTAVIEAVAQKADQGVVLINNLAQEDQARKLAAQQAAEQQAAALARQQAIQNETVIQKVENKGLSVIQDVIDEVNDHSTIATEVLGLGVGQTLAQTIVKDIKNETPTIDKMIVDLQSASIQPATGQQTTGQQITSTNTKTTTIQLKGPQITGKPAGSGTWKLIIGGTAFVVSLAGLIVMLHKYNKLPANISEFLSKLISRNAAA